MSKRLKCSAICLMNKEKIRVLDDPSNSSRKDLCIQRSDLQIQKRPTYLTIRLLVLIQIRAKKQKSRGNLRSGRVIKKDFKKIDLLDDLKKSSRKVINTRRAMLSTWKWIESTRRWIDVNRVDHQSITWIDPPWIFPIQQ